jgi:GDPmannose 4,6-dehydratase
MKKKMWCSSLNGQDGSYLAEQYLERGWDVYGIIRRHSESESQISRIEHIADLINVDYGDINDPVSIQRQLKLIKPDHIINTAGQAQVQTSWAIPSYTVQTNALSVLHLLENVKNECPSARYLQCCSSEQFGDSIDDDLFQRETTPFSPLSPYSASKIFAYNITKVYRESYNLFASNAITFNHESPRRSSVFVTQKVIKTAVEIFLGLKDKLELGSIDSQRDWSHAADICQAFYLILEHDKADNFVISSMETRSIRQLCEIVFNKLGLDYTKYVVQNPKFIRPNELEYLRGDSTKIRTQLGWFPKISFDEMIDEMIENCKIKYKVI